MHNVILWLNQSLTALNTRRLNQPIQRRQNKKNRPWGRSRFHQVENGRLILVLYNRRSQRPGNLFVLLTSCGSRISPDSGTFNGVETEVVDLVVIWFGTCMAHFYSVERSPSHTHIHSVLWSNIISNIHTPSDSLGATWGSVSFLRVFQHADWRSLGLIHRLSSW